MVMNIITISHGHGPFPYMAIHPIDMTTHSITPCHGHTYYRYGHKCYECEHTYYHTLAWPTPIYGHKYYRYGHN